MTLTPFNFNQKLSHLTLGTIAKEVCDYNASKYVIGGTANLVSTTAKDLQTAGFANTAQNMLQSSKTGFWSGLSSGHVSYCSRFFNFPGAEKIIPGCVKSLDISLLETGAGKGLISKLGGEATVNLAQSAGATTTAEITGTTAAKLAGKALARTSVLACIVAVASEYTNIRDGFKNGEGLPQLGRSAITVGATVAGTAIGGALLAPIIPPLGSIVGATIGGMIGSKIGKALGNGIFGKSKKDKLLDGDYTKEYLTYMQNYDYGALGANMQSTYTGGVAETDALIASSQELIEKNNAAMGI